MEYLVYITLILIWIYWFWIFLDPTDQDFFASKISHSFTKFFNHLDYFTTNPNKVLIILNWMEVHKNSESGIVIFHLFINWKSVEKLENSIEQKFKSIFHIAHSMWFSCVVNIEVYRFSEKPKKKKKKNLLTFWN